MALSQAAADGHAAEVCEREEADRNRSQGDVVTDASTGSDNGGTVLARVSAQSVAIMPHCRTARSTTTTSPRTRRSLSPTGSADSPIDVDRDEYYPAEVVGDSGRLL